MTEREKIVEILKENFMARKEVPIMITHTEKMQVPIEIWKICQSIINGVVIPYFADTLIENGIGDIAEWKARAKRTELNNKIKERALENESRYCEIMMGFAKDEQDLEKLVQHRIENAKKQAEREIEEKQRNEQD